MSYMYVRAAFNLVNARKHHNPSAVLATYY